VALEPCRVWDTADVKGEEGCPIDGAI
jgi:hypothetical protein